MVQFIAKHLKELSSHTSRKRVVLNLAFRESKRGLILYDEAVHNVQ